MQFVFESAEWQLRCIMVQKSNVWGLADIVARLFHVSIVDI